MEQIAKVSATTRHNMSPANLPYGRCHRISSYMVGAIGHEESLGGSNQCARHRYRSTRPQHQQCVKVLVVSVSDAISEPGTVVVHLQVAAVAPRTVVRPLRLHPAAFKAILVYLGLAAGKSVGVLIGERRIILEESFLVRTSRKAHICQVLL